MGRFSLSRSHVAAVSLSIIILLVAGLAVSRCGRGRVGNNADIIIVDSPAKKDSTTINEEKTKKGKETKTGRKRGETKATKDKAEVKPKSREYLEERVN